MTSKMLIAAAVAAALATPAFAQGREEFQETAYQTQAPAQFTHQQIVEGRNASVIQPTVGTDRATALGN